MQLGRGVVASKCLSQATSAGRWEGLRGYAILEPALLRWKITRRNVCTAVAYYD